MSSRYRVLWSRLAALASLLVTTAVTAAGLSVTPISLEFSSAAPAQALWLSNTGDQKIDAQLRVFAWNQAGGKDQLQPTRDLVLSPPMIALQPGQKQLVRVIRTVPPGTAEGSYRILVDELPDPAKLQQGLHFVMQFSIPVFADTAPAAAPALEWRLERQGDKLTLITDNKGARRAKVTDIELFDGQGRNLLQRAGLLGYVLAGASSRWPLKLDAATTNTTEVRARVNGTPERYPLRLAPGAR